MRVQQVHNIEGCIPQLVKVKTLNLVGVGLSPMVGVISCDVIFNEFPAQYCLAEPACGGDTLLFKST